MLAWGFNAGQNMNISPAILENLKYFITTIVETALSQSGWNNHELHRALKWATYCEKVFMQLAYCGDNEQKQCLESLSKIIPGMSAAELGNILKKPASALNQALMQNPNLDEDVFIELLNINLHDKPNENFFKDVHHVAQTRAITIHLLENLLKYSNQNLGASIWIASLKHTMEKQPKILDELFNNTWHSKDLLSTTLEIFTTMDKEAKEKYFARLMDKFLQHCTHQSSKIMLLHQNSVTLTQLAVSSISFFDMYVDLLVKEAALLQSTGDAGTSVIWKHSPPHISFQQLTTHWTNLLKAKPSIKERAISILQKLTMDTTQPVWQAIYASVAK